MFRGTNMKKFLFIAAFGVLAAASQASFTVATFADPSGSGSNPLFTFNGVSNQLAGAWTGTGLTLETPGFIGGGSTPNVKFIMNPVSLVPIVAGVYYAAGPGSVVFYTTVPTSPIFTVTFDGGTLLNPFSFGGSTFQGNNVQFTGPNVPSGLSGQQFAFSFANPVNTGTGWTYTASFTSSAVPEPATMFALVAGVGLLAARRRRSK